MLKIYFADSLLYIYIYIYIYIYMKYIYIYEIHGIRVVCSMSTRGQLHDAATIITNFSFAPTQACQYTEEHGAFILSVSRV